MPNSSNPQSSAVLAQLMAVIEDRKQNPPEKSYTTKLFNGGVEAAGEPGTEGRDHLIYEAADLIYHLFVMLGHKEIALTEVESELARRFGISGIDEKEARSN